MSLDESTTLRLALIRYLYTVAVAQSEQPEPMAALSILGFHDAAEMFLQLASERVGASPPKRTEFMDYWKLIGEKLPAGLTQEAAMFRFNKARVALKHNGLPQNRMVIVNLRETVANFFSREYAYRLWCRL